MSITSVTGVMDLVHPGKLDDYSIKTGMRALNGRRGGKENAMISLPCEECVLF
jgi:hypothetical protein